LNHDAAAPSTGSSGSHEEFDGELSGSKPAANSDMAIGIAHATGGGELSTMGRLVRIVE
jgi:hypothetical protein